MTLIEKIAKAMYESIGLKRGWEHPETQRVWGRSIRFQAIAALVAMRNPDDEEGGRIETAGMFALPFDKIYDGEPYKQANSALLCWQAMIDQAIKEGE